MLVKHALASLDKYFGGFSPPRLKVTR